MQRLGTHAWLKSIGALAAIGSLVACGSQASGVKNGVSTHSNVTAASAQPDATAVSAPPPDGTASAASDPAMTDAPVDTVPVSGRPSHPEGTWTFIRRLEEANPPYTDFLAGQPDAQQWRFEPQCDGDRCDLKVFPGDNGYLPAGWPAGPHDGDRVFTLALQPDGSYAGTDTVDGLTSCEGSDGTSVENAANRSYDYHLVYLAANGPEAAHIEGTLTVNGVPNAAGAAAGCPEYHDVQGLFAQPLDEWIDVDPHTLTFGQYDWAGRVTDADQYYLDHTAGVGEFVHFNSRISMEPACTGDPCTLSTTGAAPADNKARSTLTWQDGQLVTSVSYEDTCVANDGRGLLVQHGYDVVTNTTLRPVIIVHGEVLAWLGTFSSVSTPTAEAAASWPDDCTPGHESEAVAASTTQPYFHGL